MYNYNHKFNPNCKFLRKYLLAIVFFPIQFEASKEEVKT